VNSYLGEFSKAAQKLSRNPLGIIALFIVLVYGIAALVLGVSSNSLQANERLPLIYFLVFFPVIVLIAFYRLVSKHHVKLYAPHDFQDKEGFFRALSPLEQKQKLEEEIKSFEEEIKTDGIILPVPTEKKVLSVEMEGSGILKTISTRHAYVLAEELAFREIESEFGVSVHRQVAIGRDYGIDGIFLQQGKPIAIEIKYTKRPQHTRMIMRRELDRFSKIAQSMGPEPSFLLAIVVEGLNEEQRNLEMDRLMKMSEEANLPVQIRIFHFEELKEKYGFSEAGTQQTHAQGRS
jgi:cytochrome c oxidase subunit IV